MGQYYRVITKKDNKHYKIYNRNIIVNGKEEYMMAKLTEHSWWYNPFVNAIAEKIYKNPHNVVWLGDYSNDFMVEYPSGFNNLSVKKIKYFDKIAWGDKDKSIAINSSDFLLDEKYLVNHTKQEFVNCSEYFDKCVMGKGDNFGWCLHPLSLLTCIGNGCGGGDYRSPTEDSTFELVGTWAFDNISVEDNVPENFIKIEPIFKEKGWD